eukprot:CAMPEP_0172575548 /NCGR_PEP_ID=MMETSP1067-20121228/137268_1 /TAXON_ID=265564 ORGANISM="Thalassiosira punctigera, Strain Tpunct2005C2" /NCGR_SAMPLE_ID=MMETSP1067 /ASSEMBLY_ACC=CAM_ASM_000444 /LENGTH=1044 /DNA_ID=CAMNT_0013368199 /DNA_START=23 /DNA_END=3153 /DNA_ORIENTATION=+
MAKSVPVLSATTAAGTTDPSSKRRGNAGGEVGDDGDENDAARNPMSEEEGGGSDDNDSEPAASTPAIDFNDAFSELQKFKRENGGSLYVPISHPVMGRIVDGLSASPPGGMESLCKRRWEDQLAALREYKKSVGPFVPVDHPTLGIWVTIQQEQCALYERGKPSALTKKRYGKLRAVGFGCGSVPDGNERKSGKNGRKSNEPGAESDGAPPRKEGEKKANGKADAAEEPPSDPRWDDQMALLKKYVDKGWDVGDISVGHPALRVWIGIQREQYRLYERGKPGALTKKQFGKLKGVGFGGDGETTNGNEQEGSDSNHATSSSEDNSKKETGKAKSEVARSNDDKSPQNVTETKENNEVRQEENSKKSKALVGKNSDKSSRRENKNKENEKTKHEEAARHSGENDSDKGGKLKSSGMKNNGKSPGVARAKLEERTDDEDEESDSDTNSVAPGGVRKKVTKRKEENAEDRMHKRGTPQPPAEVGAKKGRRKSSREDARAKQEEAISWVDDPAPDKITRKKTLRPKEEDSDEDSDAGRGASPVHHGASARFAKNEEWDKPPKMKGKCDICEKGDGFWGHNLQKCRGCGVLVHELCYGMVATDAKDPDFVCHACAAVGSEAEVNVPSKIGGCGKRTGKKRELVKQEGRPRECLLCSHDGGVHAMHPLLDVHGPEGRQLAIERTCRKGGAMVKEKRLAWAHTLCASVICSNPGTQNSVYSCDKDGNCFGEDEDSESEDEFGEEGAEGSAEADDDDDDRKEAKQSPSDKAICYFAISNESVWARSIKEHRELKCFVCGKLDKTWRIPVQCAAGDATELDRWKSRHQRGTECYMAMHVGCARWGNTEPEGSHLESIEGTKCKLCYFSPGIEGGGEDDHDDDGSRDSHEEERTRTIACCYCKAHARDIVLNNPNRRKKPPGGSNVARRRPSPPCMARTAGVVKAEHQPRRNSGELKRDSHARPRQDMSEHARASFQRSLNSIREKRGSIKKKASRKRKPSAAVDDGVFFMAPNQKRPKVEFAEQNAAQFPVRGRSASALVQPVTALKGGQAAV